MECDGGDEQELTPNMLLWGQNAHVVEMSEVTRLQKQLRKVKDHAWNRWKHEYIQSTGRSLNQPENRCSIKDWRDSIDHGR